MYQTLKPVELARVNPTRAVSLSSNARNLGEALMCPASAQHINFDIYGRPANQNTLPINHDASCAMQTQYDLARHLQIENQVRPYTPVASAGMRGPYDTMGVGRDLNPRDLYGEGPNGRFVRHYNTANNTPWERMDAQAPRVYRITQPYDFTHDATVNARVY
jgi:hypothetical protein